MDTNTPKLIDIFEETKQCVYKGETYMVRDNGAIMRCNKLGCKKRPKDNVWTFGNKSDKGYMRFIKEFVHRIVATAFLGLPPSDDNEYVVDHIDTNRCNNRPENLRWVTKLENMLNNEITLRKIIDCCGSVEAFIDNPSMLNNYTHLHPGFDWMRTVSKEQAQNAYNNLKNWAKDTRKSIHFSNNKFSDNLFEPLPTQKIISDSLTENALQRKWPEPMQFSMCPNRKGLANYDKQLKNDDIFAKSDNYVYTIINKKYDGDRQVIYLILNSNCESKSYVVAMITSNAQNKFLHEILSEYAIFSDAQKHFERISFRITFTKGEPSAYETNYCEPLNLNYENNQNNLMDDKTLEYTPTITESLTDNAIQCDWKTPTEFPLCQTGKPSLNIYFNALSKGNVFCKNIYGESIIIDFAKYKDDDAFGVVTQTDNIKPWAYCKVYIKDAKYVHESYGSFFDEKGAQRCLVYAQGMEWMGGEIFDDGII